ncbi:MAG: leucyl aminopeptidase [Alphaproteobacteria bacterium]|jgi:leucyl aminopeptidase|nr:leucyl aminopeptidase [Alphaproteobacteria bacterium]
MQISFQKILGESNGTLVLGVFEEKVLTRSAQIIDSQIQGTLKRAIEKSSFTGKKDEILSILAPHGISNSQVLLVGLGNPKGSSPLDFQQLGGKIIAALSKCQDVQVIVDIMDDKIRQLPEMVANVAAGMNLRSWKFDKYKTKKKEESSLKELIFITPEPAASEKAFEPLKHVAEGVALTRHVVSEPPNILYPESMAEIASELKRLKVGVEVLDEKHMKKLGMGALLGVGQGSIRESKLIVLEWMHGPKGEPPVAFVGKGVTFDTGGISIKPSNGMEDMKYDMAGSGVVLGLFKALALRGAKVNAVGIMGMVENMPSGSAQRPADVVTSMSGQTIEVINTDAEGRLVLADALWYAQDRFKPQAMIDLATLTGAISVALGWEYAGLFSNNDELSRKLTDAGNSVGEKLWRLPMGDSYDKDIDSDIADVKNTGSGRGAGSITAAQFLQRFVNNVPWAHLDIAGMAWEKKDKPLVGKGASAFGVRLLNEFLMKYYEDRF